MQDHESIKDMFPRFTTIVNDLNTLGEKILRSLPNIWRPKVISITKAKDLKILAMDEVIGLLNVHEQELIGELQLPNGKAITLKASQS